MTRRTSSTDIFRRRIFEALRPRAPAMLKTLSRDVRQRILVVPLTSLIRVARPMRFIAQVYPNARSAAGNAPRARPCILRHHRARRPDVRRRDRARTSRTRSSSSSPSVWIVQLMALRIDPIQSTCVKRGDKGTIRRV